MNGFPLTMKSIPPLVWIVLAILLIAAILRLPYGYYTFTRIVICGGAALDCNCGIPRAVWRASLVCSALAYCGLVQSYYTDPPEPLGMVLHRFGHGRCVRLTFDFCSRLPF